MRILLALALAGCSTPETVTMTPELACPDAVRCDLIQWQVGFRPGSYIAGLHLKCQCRERDDGRSDRTAA